MIKYFQFWDWIGHWAKQILSFAGLSLRGTSQLSVPPEFLPPVNCSQMQPGAWERPGLLWPRVPTSGADWSKVSPLPASPTLILFYSKKERKKEKKASESKCFPKHLVAVSGFHIYASSFINHSHKLYFVFCFFPPSTQPFAIVYFPLPLSD